MSTESVGPETQPGVADAVRAAYEANEAVYPIGGGTALDYGSAPTRPGQNLDLTNLSRIIDYTPRDMTIVVEAGVRMAHLAATLASEGQHLPIDVPCAMEATIGGVVATNWSGPRRYGHGTIRDYVIGVNAIDGRGTPFKGGGRVVKNVAGYDFCKLLTGSLGTLAVITQLALKLKPRPECSSAIVCECADLPTSDKVLSLITNLTVMPTALDLLVGKNWEVDSATRNPQSTIRNHIVIRLEGSEPEIAWLTDSMQSAIKAASGAEARVLSATDADKLFSRQTDFSDRGAGQSDDESPMVVKVAVPPSAVVSMINSLLAVDAACTIQAHAGNGIIMARFSKFTHGDLTATLVAKLRPATARLGGSLVVVRSSLAGLTPHMIWGGRADSTVLLERIKQQFDPRDILNPGRFAYH
ncbi:MAG TPA: FAD-binding oxidoreductase [Lacipirellulaceae bacterium]|nr:FAD-binding oxidoreductase [Lacipirellulaceae bacterium]